mmetsp:Transcript_13554/g.57382  ORF Transcript_13554/g.57382 Transcript_13554/m.57382 type:complete len:243 (+) Transcript_13554:2689-3417(+)
MATHATRCAIRRVKNARTDRGKPIGKPRNRWNRRNRRRPGRPSGRPGTRRSAARTPPAGASPVGGPSSRRPADSWKPPARASPSPTSPTISRRNSTRGGSRTRSSSPATPCASCVTRSSASRRCTPTGRSGSESTTPGRRSRSSLFAAIGCFGWTRPPRTAATSTPCVRCFAPSTSWCWTTYRARVPNGSGVSRTARTRCSPSTPAEVPDSFDTWTTPDATAGDSPCCAISTPTTPASTAGR